MILIDFLSLDWSSGGQRWRCHVAAMPINTVILAWAHPHCSQRHVHLLPHRVSCDPWCQGHLFRNNGLYRSSSGFLFPIWLRILICTLYFSLLKPRLMSSTVLIMSHGLWPLVCLEGWSQCSSGSLSMCWISCAHGCRLCTCSSPPLASGPWVHPSKRMRLPLNLKFSLHCSYSAAMTSLSLSLCDYEPTMTALILSLSLCLSVSLSLSLSLSFFDASISMSLSVSLSLCLSVSLSLCLSFFFRCFYLYVYVNPCRHCK